MIQRRIKSRQTWKEHYQRFGLIFRMWTEPLMMTRVLLSFSILLGVAALHNPGYTLEKYDESPGIYYENKGTAALYSEAWRTLVYVDLNQLDRETLALRQNIHHIEMLCHVSVLRSWVGCAHFGDDLRD
jgi:hypothetical protein